MFAKAAISKTTLCGVCEEVVPKYKCPNCGVRYCSVKCYSTHKEGKCVKRTAEEGGKEINPKELTQSNEAIPPQLNDLNEALLSPDSLARLQTSTAIVSMLKNEHLRTLLSSISSANERDSLQGQEALEKAYAGIAIFREFADECMCVLSRESGE
eukprot:Nk52_evm2s1779 gene=Nk52_evmTU2s1779